MADFCEKSVQPIQMGQAATPAGWSADGKSIVLASLSRRRPELLRYNIATKSVRVWQKLQVTPASFSGLSGAVAAPRGDAYAYSCTTIFAFISGGGWS